MKIFLDDFRQPSDCLKYMYARIGKDNPIYNEQWVVVTNYDEFVAAVNMYGEDITHVSFDHDLSDEHYEVSTHDSYEDQTQMYKEKTGYDCAMWYKEYLAGIDPAKLPMIYVHSMNPTGTQRILNVFS